MTTTELPASTSFQIGRKMNIGGGGGDDEQNQRQRQQQVGDHALRELRERELALVLMNQQLSGASPQGQPPSMTQPSTLPSSLLADIYASQAGRSNPQGSLLSQSTLLQPGGARGGFDNQSQLLYTDTLNRMMPSSASASGGLGMSAGAGANPYGSMHLAGGDPSSLMLPGSWGGMNRLPPSAAGAGAMPPSGLDPLTAAFLRDNSLMRERLGARGAGDLQLPSASSNPNLGPLLGAGVGGTADWTNRSFQQQLLAESQLPSSTAAGNPFMGGFPGASSLAFQHQQGLVESEDVGKFPPNLPVVLAVPEDNQKLSSHQVLLRNQIEAFKATEDDLTTHTRGRNKPIKLGQVGIRCRHCARLPVARRQKGSTYFPASLHGLYQAAQNMNTTHMQSGLCTEMPPEYKQMFSDAMANKVSSSVAGRPYWAKTAKQLGLIDTEDGIRFIRDLTPAQIAQIKAMQQQQRRSSGGGVGAGAKGIPGRLLP